MGPKSEANLAIVSPTELLGRMLMLQKLIPRTAGDGTEVDDAPSLPGPLSSKAECVRHLACFGRVSAPVVLVRPLLRPRQPLIHPCPGRIPSRPPGLTSGPRPDGEPKPRKAFKQKFSRYRGFFFLFPHVEVA